MDTLTRLAGVIADHTKIHPAAIHPGTRIGDISTDDYEWFAILAALEQVFIIEIREREFETLITIGDFVELIDGKRSAQQEQAA